MNVLRKYLYFTALFILYVVCCLGCITLVQEFGVYHFPSNAYTFIPPSGEYHVGANSALPESRGTPYAPPPYIDMQ